MSDNYFIFFLLWGKLLYVQWGIFLLKVEFEPFLSMVLELLYFHE